jgi:hypothetical protein
LWCRTVPEQRIRYATRAEVFMRQSKTRADWYLISRSDIMFEVEIKIQPWIICFYVIIAYTCPPTIPSPPYHRGPYICIEPPLPLHMPVLRPMSSSNTI